MSTPAEKKPEFFFHLFRSFFSTFALEERVLKWPEMVFFFLFTRNSGKKTQTRAKKPRAGLNFGVPKPPGLNFGAPRLRGLNFGAPNSHGSVSASQGPRGSTSASQGPQGLISASRGSGAQFRCLFLLEALLYRSQLMVIQKVPDH